jgi:putative tricarboxylic transport membrane protein
MQRLLADPDGRADLILAIGVWVLAGAAYAGAAVLPPPLFDPLGSAAVPKVVSVVLAVLAAAIVARRLLLLRAAPATRQEDGGTDTTAPLRPDVAAGSIAIMLGYAGVMAYGLLGFREATVLFVVLLGGAMSRFRRSTMMVLVPLALVLAIGCAWLFSTALYIDLPVTRWLQ